MAKRTSTDRSTRRNTTIGVALVAVTAVAVGGGLWYDSNRTSKPSTAASQVDTTAIDRATESRGPKALEVARPANNAPNFVTILGDSISNSWGASTFEQGYRPQLVAEWQQGGRIDPVVTAISGANLGEVSTVANIPAATNLLIVELGTNDNGETKTDPVMFRQQYRDLMANAKAIAPDASVVCLGTWRNEKDGAALDSIIAGECTGRYLTLRDLYEKSGNRGPEGRPIYLGGGVGDNFHPNDRGYAAIKQRIADNVVFVDSAAGTAG